MLCSLHLNSISRAQTILRSQIGAFTPKVLLILGSGLGYLANEVENPIAVPYGDIPHFMTSTAPGHAGRLVFGRLEGQDVAMMQGRFHHYEGYSFEEVTFAVRVLRLLGADSSVRHQRRRLCKCGLARWGADGH